MQGVEPTPTRSDTDRRLPAADRFVRDGLEATLAYARERDYCGWDYGDGMSSRYLQALPVDNKWVNLAVQETVKRAPVNVRPLFRVEQRRNYKGTALFAMANLTADRLELASAPGARGVDYREEAHDLCEWLLAARSVGYAGFCGGHNHRLQHLDGQGHPNDPDIVSTTYAVKALLRGADLDAEYPEIARTVVDFIEEDLNYRPVEDGRGALVNYHMNHPEEYYTINAGALCARTLLDLHAHFGQGDGRGRTGDGNDVDDAFGLRERAEALLDHIADLQRPCGGWPYREPADASHLSMDNHHNGFVIESFQRYRQVTGSDRYADTLADALAFYRQDLFDPNGAPHFDESSPYPRDIHASTQGALVFTYAGDLAFARRILEWVFDELYAGDGRFYYRKERFFTRRVTLMRWCQAWMAYAMSEYLAARRGAAAA
ncbi:MAG: antibiotic ABC transporter permease [Haloarculaceae archaeon]